MFKMSKWILVLFFIYAAGIYVYLFYGSDTTLPLEYRGTAADPETFMNARELELSGEYSRIKNFLFFLSSPVEWVFFLFLLIFGLSSRMRNWSQHITKINLLQKAIYIFWLSLFSFMIMFPFNWIRWQLALKYGISTQVFSSWMKDHFTDFWLNYAFLFISMAVVYYLIKKSKKRWWLYAWLLSVPFSLFLMFVQPVFIDPLYHEFSPIKNKELEAKIITMAEEANIPTDHVYEVNMSEKTNAMNAYVNGIGANARIVLWDTTLNRLNDNEILFIMAHEIAHYVKKHLYIGIAGYLFMSLVGLYITNRLLTVVIRKWGDEIGVQRIGDIASIPALLLILSLLSFAASPLANIVSRQTEHSADVYAIQQTEDAEAAIGTFQQLTKVGLSEVNPPLLVKWFRYGHPTMLERINFLETYGQQLDK